MVRMKDESVGVGGGKRVEGEDKGGVGVGVG